tara:strand:+ start:5589 stop:5819 length:231 start_codon:yes stop_codon:yes gene_type:complete
MPKENYSKKQKKLAAVAEPRDSITGADLKKLGKKPKKMKEGGMPGYGEGGLHSNKKVVKTRGTGAATKGLNFHSSD